MNLASIVVLTALAAAFPQSPVQTPAAPPTGSAINMFEAITVIGCIELESDYRRRVPTRSTIGARGPVSPDHFVLTHATIAGAAIPAAALGSARSANQDVYQLTGAIEGQARDFLGRRVEVTGKANTTESTHANPTPAAAAAARADAVAPDANSTLPELEMLSIKAASGVCPTR